MTNEENEQAQLMRDKARENAAFYQPEPPSKFAEWEAEKHLEWRAKCLNLEAAMKTMAEGHKLAMEVEHSKVRELEATAVRQIEELKAQLAQMTEIRDSLLVERQHMIVGSEYRRVCEQLAQAQAALDETRHQLASMIDWADGHDYELPAYMKGWLSPDEATKLRKQVELQAKFISSLEDAVGPDLSVQEAIRGIKQLQDQCEFYRQETHRWKEACNKGDAKSHELSAQCAAMREVLRDAQMHIEADNIDWSRMNEGPDHDPSYRPVFPEIVNRCDSALSNTAGQELLSRLERWESLAKQVPQPPKAITWEHGVDLLNKLQDLAWPREALKGGEK